MPTAMAVEFPDTPYILPYDQIWDRLVSTPSPLVKVTTIDEDSAGNAVKAIKVSDNANVAEDEPTILVQYGALILSLDINLANKQHTRDYQQVKRTTTVVTPKGRKPRSSGRGILTI